MLFGRTKNTKNKKKLENFQTFFYLLLGYCAVIANSTAQVCALCNNFSGLWNPGPECLRQIPTKNCLGPYWAQLQISERFVLGVHLDTKSKVHKKNMYFKQIPNKILHPSISTIDIGFRNHPEPPKMHPSGCKSWFGLIWEVFRAFLRLPEVVKRCFRGRSGPKTQGPSWL